MAVSLMGYSRAGRRGRARDEECSNGREEKELSIMPSKNLFIAVIVAAFAAGAGLAVACDEHEKKPEGGDKPAAGAPAAETGQKAILASYFQIRTALAADKTDGIAEAAAVLAKAKVADVAKASKALGAAKDIADGRKAFGELSKALIPVVEKAARHHDVGAIYVFECPMAKPFGRWLQADEEIGNPYYGASMLKCGKKIATFGEHHEKKDDGHHGGGHGGGGH